MGVFVYTKWPMIAFIIEPFLASYYLRYYLLSVIYYRLFIIGYLLA